MTNMEILIVFTLNIAAGYFMWFFLFRKYFIDSHRHELFKLRYRLFNYAIENGIPFDDPAYLMRWEEINRMIRYSHEAHLIFIAGIFTQKKNRTSINNYVMERNKILNELDTSYRNFINSSREEQANLFFSFLLKSSLIFLCLTLIIVGIGAIILFLIFLWERTNFFKKIRPHLVNIYNDYEYYSLNVV